MLKETVFAMRDLPRLREIISIFIRYGFGSFMQRLKLTHFLSKRDEDGNKTQVMSTPRRVRLAFETLGPTFIKLGQILSTRVDIFNPEWIREFEHLQNNVKSLDHQTIDQLIAEHSPFPVDKIYQSIDRNPVGSASIAQVHRATLLNGNQVVIKVKRPDVEQTIRSDLRILTHIANLIESEIPEARRYQPVEMVQYFTRSLRKETDLSFELKYLERFSAIFQDHPSIHIPKVYPEYSNQNILVQEYINDSLLKNLNLSECSAEFLHELAQNITETLFTMILKHGFFHADPHPGNIFVSTTGTVTFIDVGLVGFLSSQRRRELITLINALIERDEFSIQYVLSNWAEGEVVHEDQLGLDVLEMMLNYEHTPLKQFSLSDIVNDITRIMRDNNLHLPGDLVMLFKTLITLEGVVKKLDGDFELLEHAKPLVINVLKNNYSVEKMMKRSKMQTRTLLQSIDDMPQNLMLLSRRLKQGRLNINLDVRRLEQFGQQIDKSSNRLTIGIVTAALIIGSSILLAINNGPKVWGISALGLLGYILIFFNSVWLLWSIWRSGK